MILKKNIDRFYIIFLCLVFILLIIGLGSYGLAETSEARYAEISREMFLAGNYLNPELLGIYHFHKPPITYYITTLGYGIFGINEFGARFFLQVAIVLQLWLVYRICGLLFDNRKTAFISGLLYFSMFIVILSGRNLTTDAYLNLFIMASIYFWIRFIKENRPYLIYLFYCFAGLALLTKGPVAVLFILVYTITFRVILKKKFTLTLNHIAGFLLCLVIGSSWYIIVMVDNPSLFNYFIKKQLVARMTSDSFDRGKPFWYYFLIILELLLPWWLGCIPGLKKKWASIKHLDAQSKVLLLSSVILFVLFSLFKTKLILYLLPIFWMIAIFIAANLGNTSFISRKVTSITFLTVLSGIFIWILLNRFMGLDTIHTSYKMLLVALIATLAGYVLYYFIDGGKTYKPAIMGAFFSAAVLLISNVVMAENSSLINSTREITSYMDNLSNGGDKTILVDDYLLSSIPFYSGETQITLKGGHNTTDRETEFQKDDAWKKTLWDLKDGETLKRLDSISRKRNTYLLVRNKYGLDEGLSFLKDNLKNVKRYPKWTIYYND